MSRVARVVPVLCVLHFAACAGGFDAIVAAPDRSKDDRDLDASRQPARFLAFVGVKAGQKVADLAAGDGYTSELLARAVGPGGVVFSQNSEWLVKEFVGEPWGQRLATPAMKNVVRVIREFDDPLPPEATGLDIVVMNLFYHDTFWMEKVDHAKMNGAILKALRSGGVFVVVDHSARAGRGSQDAEELHRIEESIVQKEVEAAGFRLAATADFLRNPKDTRDWSVFTEGKRGTTDRFMLKFVKP